MTITINGTTGIAGVDGSAATPSVQGGDTNTGVFFPAADVVGIATGGTEKVRIASAGQIGIGGANYGTSGQVLTSSGASAAPSWAAATGQLIRAPQVLESGTSYTTPANCTAIYVEAVGGGGGNGGGYSGAGAGAYCAKYFTVVGSTAYAYAIGSGGTSSGTSGGSTTFTVNATTITAGGGAGLTTGNVGGVGGTATNGDINSRGGSGQGGGQILTTTPIFLNGAGGNSYFGGGGGGRLATGGSSTGTAALGYGGGGGGNGNAGFQGVIRIWEYT